MPIQILPPQLANQIAAGEVVERPSSVVKELVENSLDAGATRIEIDIEKGGARLIRIRDDGCGIDKEQLALALARHATSKISSLDDLEAIVSLGFRGEALASISSVSRLTLTSRTAAQSEAWQAYAEGRDMQVTVKPAAHPVGTTLEVLDLFFNTPARRKFLRTEKTELAHIDEVVRRIALARFDVSFILRHNGKVLRQYRAAANAEQRERRLAAVCGQEFLQHALAVEWEHADLKISGWVCTPQGSRAQNDMAYSYVNGRMMRDKLIHHAIRQAYQALLQDSEHPAFVLYLELDPHQVDVNVHPAKHEVRFHQARLVHDFIYQAVLTALQHATPAATAVSDAADFARDALQDATPRAAAGSSEFTAVSTPSDSAPRDYVSREHAPREYTDTPPAHAASAEAHPASVRERSAGYGGHGSYTGSYAGVAPVSREQAAAYARLMQPAPVDTSDTAAASPTAATLFPSAPSVVATTGADPRSDSANSAGGHPATAAQRPDPRPEVNDCRAPQGSLGRALSVVNGRFLLLEQSQGLALLCLPRAALWRVQAQLTPEGQPLKAQPLLIPLQLTLSAEHVTCIRSQQALLQQLGLDLHCSERNKVLVRAVPLPLRHHNLQQIIPHLLNKLCADPTIDIALLVAWLAEQLKDEQERWSLSQAVSLVADIEHLCAERVRQEYQTLIKPVQLEAAMAAFDHHD